MTEPLSPAEIVKPWSTAMIAWLRRSSPEHLEPAMLAQLADIAEDHARLVAENAKLRERAEKFRDTAAAANLKQVEQVIELGPRTLRALTAALFSMGQHRITDLAMSTARTETDTLLAELARSEEK